MIIQTQGHMTQPQPQSVEPQNPCPVVVTEVVMMKNDVIIKIDELIT